MIPNTRAMTSSATVRWTRVMPATPATELPNPMTARARIASAGFGQMPKEHERDAPRTHARHVRGA